MDKNVSPRNNETPNVIPTNTRTIRNRIFTTLETTSSIWSRGLAIWTNCMVLPKNVFMPVAVTTALHSPFLITEPEYNILPSFLPASIDSPVIADWSAPATPSIILASAVIKSPVLIRIISPGTNCSPLTCCHLAFRSTRTITRKLCFNARTVFAALLSCINPIMALNSINPPIK